MYVRMHVCICMYVYTGMYMCMHACIVYTYLHNNNHHRRGLIMGIWNSHTGIGNLLGILIPGIWAHRHW